MFTLRLLGGLSLWSEGSLVAGRSAQKRRLALLSLVASAPTRVVSRDKLIGQLWPESDREQARHLLSVALYELRKTLGEEVLLSRGDDVALDREAFRTDVAEFEEALAADDIERAIGIYGGSFLDGFYISDSPDFEHWVDGERDRLARRHEAALERLADSRAALGDRRGAVEAWSRLASSDPFNSRIARGLMEALAAAGDRAGALQHARAHEALLKEEFGSSLGADLTSLVARLRDEPSERFESEGAPTAAAAPSAAPSPTIAVLPIVDIGPPGENQYFAEGLGEEIVAALSTVPGLLVASRTSTFALRDGAANLRDTGRALQVRRVLEGTVRRAGEQLRVTASLVDVETGYRVWGGSYDRTVGDVFVIQSEIAAEVAGAVQLHVVNGSGPVHPRQTTPSLDSHHLYLKGRYHWYRRTTQDLKQALGYFELAVARDPTYALAYNGIGDVYSLLGAHDYGALPPSETFPAAKRALARALELDPGLASAHAALGNVNLTYDWDAGGAEAHFRRALEVDPGCAPAYHWYGLLLLVTGREEEALTAMRRARELEPLSLVMITGAARLLYFSGNPDRAVEEYRRALEMDPSFVTAHLGLGLAWLQLGKLAAALEEYRLAHTLLGEEQPLALALIAHAEAISGNTAAAESALRSLEWEARARYVPPEYLALVHIGLGQQDEALDRLEEAYANRSGSMAFLRLDPLLDPLRGRERFEALQGKVMG